MYFQTRSISETSPSISGPVPEPIGKGRSSSTSGSGLADSNLYFRAPGSERDDCQQQAKLVSNFVNVLILNYSGAF